MMVSYWLKGTWRCVARENCSAGVKAGLSNWQIVELTSPELIATAQREARTLYEEDPNLNLPEHQLLSSFIGQVYADSGDVS